MSNIRLKSLLEQLTTADAINSMLNKFADRYNGSFQPHSNIEGEDASYFDAIQIKPNESYVFTADARQDYIARNVNGAWEFMHMMFGTDGDRHGVSRARHLKTEKHGFREFMQLLQTHVKQQEKMYRGN